MECKINIYLNYVFLLILDSPIADDLHGIQCVNARAFPRHCHESNPFREYRNKGIVAASPPEIVS